MARALGVGMFLSQSSKWCVCDDAEVKQTTPSSITHYTVHVRVFIYTVCAPSHTEHRNRIGTEQCLSLWVKMVVAEVKVPYPCQRSHRGNLITYTRSGLHWSLCRCKHFPIIRTAGSGYTTVSTATCAVSIGMVSSSHSLSMRLQLSSKSIH